MMTFFFLSSPSGGCGDGLLTFFTGLETSVIIKVAGRSFALSDVNILSLIALSISARSVTVVVVTNFDDLVVINVLALLPLSELS
jgi:hypothetical protein